MIKIIDCGSQLTQNIARRVRELGVFTEIVPYHTNPSEILTPDLEGLIISGGQFSVNDDNAPMYAREILVTNTPVLGICYGQQSIARLLGAVVTTSPNREYGGTKIHRTEGSSPLFHGIGQGDFTVWMSHADIVEPNVSLESIAESENGHCAALEWPEKNLYAVQFHPEVDHTEYGREILKNFVLGICNADPSWKPTNRIAETLDSIREQVKDGLVITGTSGGVDSTTLAALMQKAVGDRAYAVFVNNGVLRKGEAEEVVASFTRLGLQFTYVDASQRFLKKLKGVVDPDEKRKILGNEFIAVFEEQARNLQGVKYLGQGTLYPDVIESVPIYGASDKIKRHHNVGGLPEKMDLKLIEPFRELFKDEVRVLAEELGIPKEITWRHPFPGPGLAIRMIGDVTPEKLEILREADHILTEELKQRDLYYQIAQGFAVLTNAQAVGVMGDGGTYQSIVGLRIIGSKDFMTSDIFHFDWPVLQSIANRIVNEVPGVNRVVYDITQKPPATIEWE